MVNDNDKAKSVYLPAIQDESAIIEKMTFETIWEWLPKDFKLSDPVLAYSARRDGWSLKTVYSKVGEFKNGSMLILIKSDKNTVFGAFVDTLFDPSEKKYMGSNDSFVFQIKPEERMFNCKVKDGEHLLNEYEYFSIGSKGNGPAIYLDSELLNGHTAMSGTYNNYQFNGSTDKNDTGFQCLALEIYIID